MANDGRIPAIHYEYPFFEDCLEPKGALAINKESHACFYYAMLAAKARALAGTGPDSQIIEYRIGETPADWLESRDEELARSVAYIYGFATPESFLKTEWKKRAWEQCRRFDIDLHPAILEVKPDGPKIH